MKKLVIQRKIFFGSGSTTYSHDKIMCKQHTAILACFCQLWVFVHFLDLSIWFFSSSPIPSPCRFVMQFLFYFRIAHNIKSNSLLLIHSTGDENVQLVHSMLLTSALTSAGITFNQMVSFEKQSVCTFRVGPYVIKSVHPYWKAIFVNQGMLELSN